MIKGSDGKDFLGVPVIHGLKRPKVKIGFFHKAISLPVSVFKRSRVLEYVTSYRVAYQTVPVCFCSVFFFFHWQKMAVTSKVPPNFADNSGLDIL